MPFNLLILKFKHRGQGDADNLKIEDTQITVFQIVYSTCNMPLFSLSYRSQLSYREIMICSLTAEQVLSANILV